MNFKEALESCIFYYLSGSHCYGTNVEGSDEDYRGVFIAPLVKAFDLFQTSFIGRGSIEQQLKNTLKNIEEGATESAIFQIRSIINESEAGDLNLSVGTVSDSSADNELQELRKFLKLATECNPNIIEALYVDRGIKIEHPIFTKIRANRHLFLSKKARFTFSGYAISQLKRIKTHRGYLLNPKSKPNREDFGLHKGISVIPHEHLRSVLSLKAEWIDPNLREMVLKEQKYHEALKEYNSYEKWKTERNEKRRELEKVCGFDSKHSMHLMRLLTMAVEILRDNTVKVHRHEIDADKLLAIRNGELSYDTMISMSEEYEKLLEPLYITSTLPKSPDKVKIAELYKEICEEYYNIKLK